MADSTQIQDQDLKRSCVRARGSRSPSPVLIYPPPQHITEQTEPNPSYLQSPTLLREPQRSSSTKSETLTSTTLASSNSDPLKTNSEAPTLLREPLRSPSGKVETSDPLPHIETLTINSNDQHPTSTDSSLDPALRPVAQIPLPTIQPLSTDLQDVVRSESPPPPPVPPLPTSYRTCSPSEPLSTNSNDQVFDSFISLNQEEMPPISCEPVEDNLNKSQNSIGPVNSLMCRETTPSPEIRRGHPRMRRPRQNSDQGASVSEVAAPSPTSPKALVVTDLDQAMAQMDEQKLKSRFRSQSSPIPPDLVPPEDHSSSGTTNNNIVLTQEQQEEEEETNIDDEPASAKRIANLKQKSLEVEQSTSTASCLQNTAATTTPTTSRQRRRRSERDKVVPAVTFDEALKMPSVHPAEIDLRNLQEFDGEALATWLCSEFNESHYLHSTLTRHDFRMLVFQVCTHLLSLGILRPSVEKKPPEVFKAQNQYTWAAGSPDHDHDASVSQPSGSASFQSCSQTSLPMEDRSGRGGDGAGESTGACQHQDAGSSWTDTKAKLSNPSIVVGPDAAGEETEAYEAQGVDSDMALSNISAAAASPEFQRHTLSRGSTDSQPATTEETTGETMKRQGVKPRRMLPGLSRSSPSLPDDPRARFLDVADIGKKMNDDEERRATGGGDRRRDFDSDSRLDDTEPVSGEMDSAKSSEFRPKSLLNLRDAEVEPISLLLSSSRTSDGRSKLPWAASPLTPSPSLSEMGWESTAGWSAQSPQPGRKHRLLPPSPPGSLRSTPCSSHAHLATPMSPTAGTRSPRLSRLSAFFRSDKAKAAGIRSQTPLPQASGRPIPRITSSASVSCVSFGNLTCTTSGSLAIISLDLNIMTHSQSAQTESSLCLVEPENNIIQRPLPSSPARKSNSITRKR
ncbi:protein cappuccino [Elysia marginata]|uniref:Protein cappuccino n=1 Tax=Elysia marginata TaxID=1093978 RepID=A0AAV4EV93_9GAST|nr:protein cappuccino [Elysia marginata]